MALQGSVAYNYQPRLLMLPDYKLIITSTSRVSTWAAGVRMLRGCWQRGLGEALQPSAAVHP